MSLQKLREAELLPLSRLKKPWPEEVSMEIWPPSLLDEIRVTLATVKNPKYNNLRFNPFPPVYHP